MTIRKCISILLNSVYILAVMLFVLDGVTAFEIKSQMIKSFTYFGIPILTPTTLIWNFLFFKSKRKKLIGSILLTLVLIGILTIGPMEIVFSSAAWRTQTILYQNSHLNYKKVEFQMQDVGSLGYNKRTVEVIYLTNFFMIIRPVDKNIDERVEWIKLDKEVNELGLKYP